jgi:hypothetical protein
MNSLYDSSDSDAISPSENIRICLRPVKDTTPHDAVIKTAAATAAIFFIESFIICRYIFNPVLFMHMPIQSYTKKEEFIKFVRYNRTQRGD